jgi:hypothetical protein
MTATSTGPLLRVPFSASHGTIFFLCGSTALVDLGRFFCFLILYTDSRPLRKGYQSVARPLPTHRTVQTQNKRTQTSMPQ